MDARSRRAGRLARRGPRADHARAGIVVQAGDHPDKDPGPHRDGRPDQRARPVPGRSPAIRIPARRCRAAPEQGPRRVGEAGAPSRTGPGHGAGRHVDVQPAAGRAQHCPDHPCLERCRGAVPVRGRPGPEPAPHRHRMDAAHSRCDPGNPRYTGRQVWNRQRTDFDLADPVDTSWGTGRCSGGTCPKAGSSWSAPASLEAPKLADLPIEYHPQVLYSRLPRTFSEAYPRRMSGSDHRYTTEPSQP